MEGDRPTQMALDGGVAVLDIGSNSVRMVIYDGFARVPFPLFNEKVACGLGRGLAKTGKLSPEGVLLAKKALTRFFKMGQILGISRTDLMATAAMRDAEDGPDFARWIEALFGSPVNILSGADEAQLAAHGVLCGIPDADGIVGDLGGGSLDVVSIDHGRFGNHETLPLGHLRLLEESDGKIEKAAGFIEKHMEKISWVSSARARNFYVVGGAWRSIARVFMYRAMYPLNVIDNYVVSKDQAVRLLNGIIKASPEELASIPTIAKRRVHTLPLVSLVMRRLIEMSEPAHLVFSGYSMREGQFLKSLPDELRYEDPLLAACSRLIEQRGRFEAHGHEIFDWMSPLFPVESKDERRLRLATCLLSDISWFEHPDFRASHAFQRALHLPFAGLTHRDRAMLAFAIAFRYDGEPKFFEETGIQELVDEEGMRRARTLGSALRLATTLCHGAPGLLGKTQLSYDGGVLELTLPNDGIIFSSDPIQRRVQALVRALDGKKGIVEGG